MLALIGCRADCTVPGPLIDVANSVGPRDWPKFESALNTLGGSLMRKSWKSV
jgi:hypothetical protein